MFWDIFVGITLTVTYIISLSVFLVKRVDRRLTRRWHRNTVILGYILAGLILIGLMINLVLELL